MEAVNLSRLFSIYNLISEKTIEKFVVSSDLPGSKNWTLFPGIRLISLKTALVSKCHEN